MTGYTGSLGKLGEGRAIVTPNSISAFPVGTEQSVAGLNSLADGPKVAAGQPSRDPGFFRLVFEIDRDIRLVEITPLLGQFTRQVLLNVEFRSDESTGKTFLSMNAIFSQKDTIVILHDVFKSIQFFW
jgi:hypothetical protein